jgi:hypothetical protein
VGRPWWLPYHLLYQKKSHTFTPIYNYFTDSTPKFRKMIQHLNHKLLVNKIYQVQELSNIKHPNLLTC